MSGLKYTCNGAVPYCVQKFAAFGLDFHVHRNITEKGRRTRKGWEISLDGVHLTRFEIDKGKTWGNCLDEDSAELAKSTFIRQSIRNWKTEQGVRDAILTFHKMAAKQQKEAIERREAA